MSGTCLKPRFIRKSGVEVRNGGCYRCGSAVADVGVLAVVHVELKAAAAQPLNYCVGQRHVCFLADVIVAERPAAAYNHHTALAIGSV